MIKVLPSTLEGNITMQPSKSVLHRLLICAALAKGQSAISNFALSQDISATLYALRDMGFCDFEITDKICVITGGMNGKTKPVIDCGESGSTLRFLLPLAFDGQKRLFTGKGRLMERPMQPYEILFEKCGYKKTEQGIAVHGNLKAAEYAIAGDISSQFISGLLFQLPMLEIDSYITLTSKLESKPYVDITRHCQALFGVQTAELEQGGYQIIGNQRYRPADAWAEGDYSHAAFFAVAAALGGSVSFTGLNPNSLQGDKQIFEILRCMDAEVAWQEDVVTVKQAALKPVELDVSQIPDLVPILAVLACAASGRTKLYNAGRLRFKESDRLHAITLELEKLGADIMEYEDSLVIYGAGKLNGGSVSAHNDHRIAMALTIASCISEGNIEIDQPEVVAKSAPNFYKEFEELGGRTQ